MNRIKDYAKLADSIVQWIKDYTRENLNGVIIVIIKNMPII